MGSGRERNCASWCRSLCTVVQVAVRGGRSRSGVVHAAVSGAASCGEHWCMRESTSCGAILVVRRSVPASSRCVGKRWRRGRQIVRRSMPAATKAAGRSFYTVRSCRGCSARRPVSGSTSEGERIAMTTGDEERNGRLKEREGVLSPRRAHSGEVRGPTRAFESIEGRDLDRWHLAGEEDQSAPGAASRPTPEGAPRGRGECSKRGRGLRSWMRRSGRVSSREASSRRRAFWRRQIVARSALNGRCGERHGRPARRSNGGVVLAVEGHAVAPREAISWRQRMRRLRQYA